MKKLLLLLFLIGFLQNWISAQEVFSSGGEFIETPTGSLSWTIGEPISETFSDGMAVLTQGFQQGFLPQSICQELFLLQGWSLISTYIIPAPPTIGDVFLAVGANLILLKDGNGNVYWPYFFINTIGNLAIEQAYKPKMSSADTLSVCGIAVVPENTPVSLPQGWSLLGYLRQSPASITTVLSSILSETILVKDGNGSVFWPIMNIEMIGDMMPGKGYQIKLASAQVLIYPANSNTLKTVGAYFP